MADERRENGPSARQNIIEAVAWLILAGSAFWMSFDFDRPLPIYELGPAFWPRLVLAGIFLAALGVLVGTFMQRLHRRAEGGEKSRGGAPAAVRQRAAARGEGGTQVTAKVLAAIGLPILYVYLIHQFGFYLITPFFLAGYMCLLGVRNWIRLVTVTVGLYALLVVIFIKLIYTPLPQGAGFFHALNGQFIGLIQ